MVNNSNINWVLAIDNIHTYVPVCLFIYFWRELERDV